MTTVCWKTWFTEHNIGLYVVDQKLKHFDDTSFTELFVEIDEINK